MNKRLIRLVGPAQREFVWRCIHEAPDGWFVQISAPTRTLEQNAKLWASLADLQEQVPELATYSLEDLKLRFMHALGAELRFLPVLEGEGMFPVGFRSSQLTKEQCSALLELIEEYGARHGVQFHDSREAA